MKRGLMLLLLCSIAFADLITVTPDMTDYQAYTAIESARAGDIVEIAPGTYKFRVFLDNDGTADNPIIIRAQDPANRPVWDLGGQYCENWPGSFTAGDRGRGAWQIRGSYYMISGLIIRNAHMANGESSGIRPSVINEGDAEHVTIRNCLIEGNDNGIVGNGQDIVYEFCEIRNNGNTAGDMTHNVYNHGGTITIRYCYIHDPVEGQNFHMRATDAIIEYSIIENGRSYMGDIMTNTLDRSNGEPITQTLTLLGNLIFEDPNPVNDAQVFVTYNDQEWPGTSFRFNMYYNTFVGNGKNAALAHITNKPGTVNQEWYLYNNVFYGNTRPFRIDISSGYHVESRNNWWPQGDYSQWSQYMSNDIFGTDPFVDINNRDYKLGSPIAANTGIGLQPDMEPYEYLLSRARAAASDIGAFETKTDTPLAGYQGYDYCPPLPQATGNTITVSTAAELTYAISSASSGTTILLNDGTYNINSVFINTPLTIRSASGNRDSVIIDGQYSGGSIFEVRAPDVTIADLTLRRAYEHPVHAGGNAHYLKLYNLHIVDARQQFVKVNPSYQNEYNDYGELACSLLELTPEGRQYIEDHPTSGYECYTGGPDLHQSWGWTIRDNTIKDIYCTNGGLAEHAIHFWQTNRDPTVERNIIINCARGIGFGLGNQGADRTYPDDPLAGTGVSPSIVDHIGGTIRNNFIFSDIAYYDTGIGLEAAWNVTVAHNTIYSKAGNSWNSAIDTRFEASNPSLVNNLYYPRMTERNGGTPTKIDNVLATAGMFVDMDNADLHLESGATVIDSGTAGYAATDIDGNYRDSQPDIGADEYGSGYVPSCAPMTLSALNLEINAWKGGGRTITQLMAAIREWKEGCN